MGNTVSPHLKYEEKKKNEKQQPKITTVSYYLILVRLATIKRQSIDKDLEKLNPCVLVVQM